MNICEIATKAENCYITFQILIYPSLVFLPKDDYMLWFFFFSYSLFSFQQLDLFDWIVLVLITSSEALGTCDKQKAMNKAVLRSEGWLLPPARLGVLTGFQAGPTQTTASTEI